MEHKSERFARTLSHFPRICVLARAPMSMWRLQISEIEGLDSCMKLQCLSLGNNQIFSLDSIIRLRRFPKLQLVNLEVTESEHAA